MEVLTAVYDWQQDARRKMDYTSIYADRINTEAALFNDAVRVFSVAFRESNAIRSISSVSLRCTDYRSANSDRSDYGNADAGDTESEYAVPEKWLQGMQILQMLDQVPINVLIVRKKADVLIECFDSENRRRNDWPHSV